MREQGWVKHHCQRKQRYTRKGAFGVAIKLKKAGHVGIVAYQCGHCDGYHVGHKPGS